MPIATTKNRFVAMALALAAATAIPLYILVSAA